MSIINTHHFTKSGLSRSKNKRLEREKTVHQKNNNFQTDLYRDISSQVVKVGAPSKSSFKFFKIKKVTFFLLFQSKSK